MMEENYSEHTEEITEEKSEETKPETAETEAAPAPESEPVTVSETAAEPESEPAAEPETAAAEPEKIVLTEAAPEEIRMADGHDLSREEVLELIRTEMAGQKSARSHPVLVAGLAALVGLGAGFGGGYAAYERLQPEAGEPAGETETIPQQNTQPVAAYNTGGELSLQQIAAKASPTVVEIRTEVTGEYYAFGFFGGEYTSQAAGSGVILSDDGYIITNNHVVADAKEITVTLYDGTEYPAEVIGADSKSDIAVIRIDAKNLPAAETGDSSALQVGDTAVVIGNPLGTLGGTVTNGIISAASREVTINREAMTLIQTNAAINSGNSGGGLFDGYGRLIGIVNAKDSGTTSSGATIEGLGFAIPINEALDVAQQLIEKGYVTDRATIGVMLSTITNTNGRYTPGLYISEVLTGTGAEKAGLEIGDRIIAVDGQDAGTYEKLSHYLKGKNIGDTITLTIVRDEKEMKVDVTLGEAQNTQTKE